MYPENLLGKMQEIVDNCMGDAPPYCEATCPLHTDVKGYVNLIAEGKHREAAQLIRDKLFLPATLGRICAHPCEEKCKRGELHHPMSIAALKRFAAAYDNEDDWDISIADEKKETVSIIGAGPSGAQAALDLRKKGYKVEVFEKLSVPGGMLRVGIPEYRLPRNIIDHEYSYLEKLGVQFHFDTEIGVDISFEEIRKRSDAVLIAVGSHKSVMLPLPGVELEGVIPAVDFLRVVSLEKKYPAGKKVAVIGGGNVAIDVARSLRRVGTEDIQLFCLESRSEMPAHEWEIKEAEEEGITVNSGWGPSGILGKEGRVSGLSIKKCLSVFDKDGKFDPVFDETDSMDIDFDSVILAVGQATDSSFLSEKSGAKVDRNGRIQVDPETLETGAEGIFAAGDAVIRPWLAIEAMALGRKAATSIDRFLRGESLSEGRENEGSYETWLEKDVTGEEILPRVETPKRKPEERVLDFAEVDLGLSEEMALKEASRCLKCECKLCMKECLMLNEFCECPKELFQEILASEDVDPLIPYSCNMCNQCTLECPKDFRMSENFYDIRKELVKEGRGPLKAHKPISVHQKLGYSKIFNITLPDRKAGFTKRVFFPGCSLPSYNPEAVGKVLEYLQEKLPGTGAVLKCCGKPTKALGLMDDFHERFDSVIKDIKSLGADEIVVACQSCYATFKQYCPEMKVRSLWEIFMELGIPEDSRGIGEGTGLTFAIHDSCVTRDVPVIHDGIRFIMKELGYGVEEMPHSREHTRCCGFGGMIVPANPPLAKKIMDRRAQEAESDHVVTYCAACRASMVSGGKNGLHILDLIFGGSWEGRETPANDGALQSWIKRWRSKQELQKVTGK